MQKKPTVLILTQGCKVNQYESEAIAEEFEREGFSVLHEGGEADICIVNTCTVTAESDRKAGQLARRLHAKNPNSILVLTGCFAQREPSLASLIEGVDAVIGNTEKMAVVRVAKALFENGKPNAAQILVDNVDDAAFEPMQIARFERTRAYVKIEDGCENKCAYCAIPSARGRVRSKPLADVVREVEGLVAGGCREAVLTGIETASWGRDLDGVDLADLLVAVDAIKGIGRVRLGSLDPSLMREKFVSRIKDLKSLTPHFHISMQSGSSAVLAAMRRKYNREMALEGIKRLREAFPDCELTTDFIVGFPGETDEDFANTMSLAREAEFLTMHVFPYSRRRGTPAATLPNQVPTTVKKERSAALIALGRELHQKRLERALSRHATAEVLFETFENGFAIGHTASFLEVCIPSERPLHSQLHRVELIGVVGERILCKLQTD